MNWETGVYGLAAGFLIAVVTAPVGVSGAVFLLPVQLSVLMLPLGIWLLVQRRKPEENDAFAASVVGAVTYFGLSFTTTGDIAPEWALGLMCGLGGLVGGYVGAHLQPRVPAQALRRLLGALAAGLAVLYAVQAFRMVG